MEFLGLTTSQLLVLAGLGVLLLMVLFVLKRLLRLTKACLGLGCLGIVVFLIVAFVALRGLAG